MSNLTTQDTFAATERLEKAWQQWGGDLTPCKKRDAFTPIIPAKQCRTIIELIDTVSVPAKRTMRIDEVEKIVGDYLGSFSDLGKHNNKVFLARHVETLGEYPVSIHRAAMSKVINTSPHMPSIALLVEALDEERARLSLMKLKAKRDLKQFEKEAEARRKIEERKTTLEAEYSGRDDFIKEMREKFGDDAVGLAQKVQTEAKPKEPKTLGESVTPKFTKRPSFNEQIEILKKKAAE